jgi:hypothetical protein
MPQTFSQNGHTLGSMWTFWSSWPSEKPCFLIMIVDPQILEKQKIPQSSQNEFLRKNKDHNRN